MNGLETLAQVRFTFLPFIQDKRSLACPAAASSTATFFNSLEMTMEESRALGL
jgi:hypothetical protein